jgi:TorA maturation chaperone TorD
VSKDSPVVVALRRSAIYRLLALAFAPPTAERLTEIASAARKSAARTWPDLRAALAHLAEAARTTDPMALAGEHVSLFERQVRCPPYEGAYGPAQMGGKASLLADVAGFYQAFAMGPAEGQPEVEDHVCAELEFMSALTFKEAWAIAEDHTEGLEITRDAQRAFLGEHLARWGSTFAGDLGAAAAPGFYPTAAALLAAWLDHECARLELAVGPLSGTTPAEDAAFTCPMAPGGEECPSVTEA